MTESSTLVQRVDFTTLPTRDLDVALEFYGTTLGLPLSARYPSGMGAEFETGNLTLSLLKESVMPGEFRPNYGPIALHVEDVASARSELESRGVEFDGDVLDSGVCHMAFFRDPDGHALMLHHRYAPREPLEGA